MRTREQDAESSTNLPRIGSKPKVPQYDSPFAIPDDAEIFRMKEREKERKREEKERNDKLKIWEKGVKKQGISIRELNELGKEQKEENPYQSKSSFIEAAKNAIKNRVRANEPMHKFVSKTRETLIFQMLIDHKREKINEFEELTKLHRKGLERAEQMLEEDMENFNNYLAENKKDARDAIKKAETQTRKKNEKVAVIKEKLEVQADLTGKNMSKKETLQNLKKYKNFLLSLSPELTEEERRRKQEKVESAENGLLGNGGTAVTEDLSDESEEEDMYFQEAEQLASIFHSLEESNLFLITNLKEMEQEMEEVKNRLARKKESLFNKKSELMTSKIDLYKQIGAVEEEIDNLRRTTNKDEISDYFAVLEAQIISITKEITKEVGIPLNQQKNVSALVVLKEIEKKIEEQLLVLKVLKEEVPNIVREEGKHCFERKKVNKGKMDAKLEEKGLKQKDEASPAREKRKGRPIMTRSIIRKEEKKKEVQVEEPQEEIERRKYLM